MSAKTDLDLRLPVPREPSPGPPRASDEAYARWVEEARRQSFASARKRLEQTPVPVRFVLA
jgi:hypothetical protein